MPKKGKERPVQMAGLLDWLDIFGSAPEPRSKKGSQHALPAPSSKNLPSVRKEERGLIQASPKKSWKEKLLSIFDVMGPPMEASQMPLVEAERVEREIVPQEGDPWEGFFSPSKPSGGALHEAFEEAPEKPAGRRYAFIHEGPKTIPYGGAEWRMPSVQEMMGHLQEKVDLEKVFSDIDEVRSEEPYQELLADAAFRGVPLYTPVSVIDDRNIYTDFADFYGIPWSVMEQVRSEDELRSKLLNPLGIILTEAFEVMKPEELGGFFMVDRSPEDGRYWLFYVEPWIGRLPGSEA